MFNVINGAQSNVKNDLLSGMTVPLTLVPEAVAFAFFGTLIPDHLQYNQNRGVRACSRIALIMARLGSLQTAGHPSCCKGMVN